jgi:hypothetical protein
MPTWPTVREVILAVWLGPPIDPDYKAACDRVAEREAAWYPGFEVRRADAAFSPEQGPHLTAALGNSLVVHQQPSPSPLCSTRD